MNVTPPHKLSKRLWIVKTGRSGLYAYRVFTSQPVKGYFAWTGNAAFSMCQTMFEHTTGVKLRLNQPRRFTLVIDGPVKP